VFWFVLKCPYGKGETTGERDAADVRGRIRQDEIYHSFFGGVARKK
jgi:hypothetical protein